MQIPRLSHNYFFIFLFLFLIASSASSQERLNFDEIDALNHKAVELLKVDSNGALQYASDAYQSALSLQYKKGQVRALNSLGAYYQTKGSFQLSMDNYMKVIELMGSENTEQKGLALLGLAQIYKDMSADNTTHYISQAIHYSKQAYKVYKSIKDTSGLSNSLSMMGISYRDKATQENLTYYDSAFAVFSQAISLELARGKVTMTLPKLYNNISQVYIEYKRDIDKGLEYLFKAVEENNRINSVWGLTHNYGNISNAYATLGQYEKAIDYGRKMLKASFEIQRPVRVYNSYKVLSTAFQAAKKFDSALVYYKLATSLNDSLANLQKTEQVVELQTKYETLIKEGEIQKLNDENEVKNSRILMLAAALVLLAGGFVAFVLLYKRVQKQKKELDLQSKQLQAVIEQMQQQKKELEEVVSVKDKLFSVISHDLRTPVNTLISFTELMQSNHLPPEKLKSYGSVLKSTLTKTADMMNNLLHWAASQMHGFNPLIQKVDVNDVAKRAINEVEQQATLKQVTIINQVHHSKNASADADMLSVILRNLLANAVKYVNPSTGEIIIGSVEENETIKVYVQDNGVGMSSDEMEQFNKADTLQTAKSRTGTHKETGTGLGLMLCSTLIRQMNGKIRATHTPGSGTTFTVYLPAA